MSIVQYSSRNNIASITLNRPEKRNALSPELIQALKESFQQAEQDNRVSVIILKANGEAFCAGADLLYVQKLQDFSYDENLADSQSLSDLFWQIYSCKKIVIAQVQGAALAGGFGLATVCDFCFAAEKAMFGYTEVKIGFVPALVMVYLLRKVGEANARRLLLTAQFFAAQEISEMGLVHGVFAKESLNKDAVPARTT
jgi:methylglutaconyl-CoA hydratase